MNLCLTSFRVKGTPLAQNFLQGFAYGILGLLLVLVFGPVSAQEAESRGEASTVSSESQRVAWRAEKLRRLAQRAKAGPKETELLLLRNVEYSTPQERRNALRRWWATNGEALKQERESKRLKEQEETKERRMALRRGLLQRVQKAEAQGSLGKLEAEYLAKRFDSQKANDQRILETRNWLLLNRIDLRAEQEQKRNAYKRPALMDKEDWRIRQHGRLADAFAEGQMGQLEKERWTLILQNFDNPERSARLLRQWFDLKGGSLQLETREKNLQQTVEYRAKEDQEIINAPELQQ